MRQSGLVTAAALTAPLHHHAARIRSCARTGACWAGMAQNNALLRARCLTRGTRFMAWDV